MKQAYLKTSSSQSIITWIIGAREEGRWIVIRQ